MASEELWAIAPIFVRVCSKRPLVYATSIGTSPRGLTRSMVQAQGPWLGTRSMVQAYSSRPAITSIKISSGGPLVSLLATSTASIKTSPTRLTSLLGGVGSSVIRGLASPSVVIGTVGKAIGALTSSLVGAKDQPPMPISWPTSFRLPFQALEDPLDSSISRMQKRKEKLMKSLL